LALSELVCCLGNCLSKHKTTRNFRNCGGRDPLGCAYVL